MIVRAISRISTVRLRDIDKARARVFEIDLAVKKTSASARNMVCAAMPPIALATLRGRARRLPQCWSR